MYLPAFGNKTSLPSSKLDGHLWLIKFDVLLGDCMRYVYGYIGITNSGLRWAFTGLIQLQS